MFPPRMRPGLGYPGFAGASRGPTGGAERGGVGQGRALGAPRARLTFLASPCGTQFACPRTRGRAGVSPSSDIPARTCTPTSAHARPGQIQALSGLSPRGGDLGVSQRAPFLGASSPRTFPRAEWRDKRA